MKALILEDDITNAWDYEMILEDLSIHVQKVCKSWKQALPIIKKDLPDLLIVDLKLGNNEDSFEYLNQIKKFFIPTIVCTGFPKKEYIEKAYEVGVNAFIAKPLNKALLSFEIRKLIGEINESKKENYITIKEKSNLINVPYKEIYKIEIERNYSTLFLQHDKKYVIKMSLRKLLDLLHEHTFIRCHRSTIVNLDFIYSIDIQNNKLNLINSEKIDLGNKFKASVKTAFIKNKS